MKKFGVIGLLAFLFISGFFLWWQAGNQPVNKNDTSQKIFVIAKGEGLRSITNALKAQGLIKDPVVFFLLVKQLGLDTKIQAGDFRLSPSMSAQEIAHALTKGSLDVWVTIPEGKRAQEIADILQSKIPAYTEDWRVRLNENEGYLFPDTYLIPKDATIDQVATLLRGTFDQKYASIPDTAGKSQEKVVTIASLVEREAITDEEKPIIAGIIQNRLNAGVALQVDATIQYAKGYNASRKSWWSPVTVAEYTSIRSPYNTYLSPGLPPGPIANPGLAALEAAVNPQNTEYFYYLHDKDGQIRYAITNDQHNSNKIRYGVSGS